MGIEEKQQKLLDLQEQIKDEKKKVERQIGKSFLKKFNMDHSEQTNALELIDVLSYEYNQEKHQSKTNNQEENLEQTNEQT